MLKIGSPRRSRWRQNCSSDGPINSKPGKGRSTKIVFISGESIRSTRWDSSRTKAPIIYLCTIINSRGENSNYEGSSAANTQRHLYIIYVWGLFWRAKIRLSPSWQQSLTMAPALHIWQIELFRLDFASLRRVLSDLNLEKTLILECLILSH